MTLFTPEQLRPRVIFRLKYTSPLLAVAYDPSGRYLFAAAQDNSIQRFDTFTGMRVPLVGHTGWVRALACVGPKPTNTAHRLALPAGFGAAGFAAVSLSEVKPFTLLAADTHGQLVWWEGHTPEPKQIRAVAAHDGWVRAVAVSPDGKTVATCGNDRLVRIWSAKDGSLVRTLVGHESHVYNVAFHPAGGHLVSADLKGIVKDWDFTTGQCVRELDAKILHKYDTGFGADIGGARGLSFDANGSTLACTGITNVSNAFAGVGNPLVVRFDWKEGKATQLKPKDAYQGTGWGVHLHPSGLVIAAGGGSDGRLWFWRREDGVNVQTVAVPTNVRGMAMHPDGRSLAVAGFNGSATLYSIFG